MEAGRANAPAGPMRRDPNAHSSGPSIVGTWAGQSVDRQGKVDQRVAGRDKLAPERSEFAVARRNDQFCSR